MTNIQSDSAGQAMKSSSVPICGSHILDTPENAEQIDIDIVMDEIKKSSCAYQLLKLLAWLDRSKTTVGFLKRAVLPQPYWDSNGKRTMRDPRDSYVPEDLVELIEGPDFNNALKELKSSGLMAIDSKELLVLHPITYSYFHKALTADEMIENAIRALSLVVHAHPIVQAELNRGYFSQDILSQLFQCDINRKNIEDKSLNYSQILRDIKREGKPTLAERTAEMLFEAMRGYGESRDDLDHMALGWAKDLLKTTTSVELQARLWCARLPLEFYRCGRLIEGCEAADEFLRTIEGTVQSHELTSRENAQLGFLRHLCVEYRVRENGLPDEEAWRRRATYIAAWLPLDPDEPSELERYAMGMGVRMRGKLAKDFGQFKEAYYLLKCFVEEYAGHGSREEGWAIGDFVQVVLELEDTKDGSEILLDLMTNGTNFGEKLVHPSGTTLCAIASFICSRAIERRMFERGHLTEQDRKKVRESDTMFLEINYAVSLLRQGRTHPERYEQSKRELLGLKSRFSEDRVNGKLWYDDQTREFCVIVYLAQIAHLRQEWEDAQSRWKEAIEYGQKLIEGWEKNHFYVAVAAYSLAHAQLSAVDGQGLINQRIGDTAGQLDKERVTWMLGVGTFWLDYVKALMRPKLRKEQGMADMGKELVGWN